VAIKCAHCRGTDIIYGFDTYQCLGCGGHSRMSDGSPTVPTSALASDGTYDGPGADLIDNPDVRPFKAKDEVK
jgi:hypothetical protein